MSAQREPFELVNVGYGEAIAIRDLVAKIIQHSGRELEVEYDLSKPSINTSLFLDCHQAREKFGWSPQTSLDEGIRQTLAWYRENVKHP